MGQIESRVTFCSDHPNLSITALQKPPSSSAEKGKEHLMNAIVAAQADRLEERENAPLNAALAAIVSLGAVASLFSVMMVA